jgi:hemin uptake protein HemP
MAARTDPDAFAGNFRSSPSEPVADVPIASPRVVTSDALLRGESQLAILHDRTVYFLRRTRFGKLILTK